MCTNKKPRHDSASQFVSSCGITKTNVISMHALHVSGNIFAQKLGSLVRKYHVVTTRLENVAGPLEAVSYAA